MADKTTIPHPQTVADLIEASRVAYEELNVNLKLLVKLNGLYPGTRQLEEALTRLEDSSLWFGAAANKILRNAQKENPK